METMRGATAAPPALDLYNLTILPGSRLGRVALALGQWNARHRASRAPGAALASGWGAEAPHSHLPAAPPPISSTRARDANECRPAVQAGQQPIPQSVCRFQDARTISTHVGRRVIGNARFQATGDEVVNVDGQTAAAMAPQPLLPSGRAGDILAIRLKHHLVVALEQEAPRQKYQRRTGHQAMHRLLAALKTEGDAFRLGRGGVNGAHGVHSDITVARRRGSRICP